MPISNRLFVRYTAALLLVGFCTLLGIVGMNFWLSERAQDYFYEVIQARDMRGAAVELRNAVQTAEASQRGFLLTGNETYLAPYDSAKAALRRQLDTLNQRLASYQNLHLAVQRLGAILTEKMEETDRTIALKRDGRDEEALAIVKTNRGKALSDEANLYFSGIISAADDRLTGGVSEQRSNARWLRLFSIIGGVLIVGVVAGAAYAAIRYLGELRYARAAVESLNAGLEERVRHRTADLALANQEQQRFTHIISHDLRAPLISIVGFTGEVEERMAPIRAALEPPRETGDEDVLKDARLAACEDVPEAIRFIRSSASKMDNLINAILKLSREGRRELRPEHVDMRDVIERSAAAIQHQLSEAEGELRLNLSASTLVTDKLTLEQIVGNLLDNAVKYRSSGRPLYIDVRSYPMTGDRIAIEVADNGRGIAKRDQGKVFELFRRVGVQDKPGEGVGLSYVQSMVRHLGGDIIVESELDQGTTFKLTLARNLGVVHA